MKFYTTLDATAKIRCGEVIRSTSNHIRRSSRSADRFRQVAYEDCCIRQLWVIAIRIHSDQISGAKYWRWEGSSARTYDVGRGCRPGNAEPRMLSWSWILETLRLAKKVGCYFDP